MGNYERAVRFVGVSLVHYQEVVLSVDRLFYRRIKMIEVLKIEDFVIEQLLLPYMPSLKEMCHEYGIKYRGHVSEQKIVERNLRRNPELIIHFLNENLETKER